MKQVDLGPGDYRLRSILPTEDSRYFLKIQRVDKEHDQAGIWMTSNLKPLYIIKEIESIAGGQYYGQLAAFEGREPRIRFLPSFNMLVMLPKDNQHVVLRKFNLSDALNESGENYLYIVSSPMPHARAGEDYNYKIQVLSKNGELRYEPAPKVDGMEISEKGELRWKVPPRLYGKTQHVVIKVRDSSGKEAEQAFDVTID
jgi:hypothetical protein